MGPKYLFESKLWVYPGEGAWYFVTLPEDQAKEIRDLTASQHRRGFGSVKVRAEIKGESWDTSIFPDTKSNSYLLPVKKEIRRKANIDAGDTVSVVLLILLAV